MAVVAARVHHADLLAVPGRAHLRGERHVDVLGDRQRIHVGAQRDDRARERALQQSDDTGVGDAALHLVEADRAQVGLHDVGGAELAVAELGMRMQVTPPRDHAGLDRDCCRIDLFGQRAGSEQTVVHRSLADE